MKSVVVERKNHFMIGFRINVYESRSRKEIGIMVKRRVLMWEEKAPVKKLANTFNDHRFYKDVLVRNTPKRTLLLFKSLEIQARKMESYFIATKDQERKT
ncbi:hypothetical protein PVK06_019088 [Gossypium arboreum]|uniref:Uncharacterized protein n=1 Tax=Gossypium arboreum TaxID=29729 RepID=A0ABR0PIP3_GOSAR|nr:hypothetical protein PVK06_019088 [Gossypium arboreum]